MVRHAKEGDQYVVYSDVYGVEMRTVLNEVQVRNAKESFIQLNKEKESIVDTIKDMEAKKEEYENKIATIDDGIIDAQEDIEDIENSLNKFNGIFDEE